MMIKRKYPTAKTIYKILVWLKKTCCKDEILFYVNQIWKEERK